MATERRKRGPLSKKEISYVEKYRRNQTPEQMATNLRRPISTIINYLAKNEDGGLAHRQMTVSEELIGSPEWRRLSEEFTEGELLYFKHKYTQLKAQFQDDILPTEESQIYHAISLDILLHRVMKEQKEAEEDRARLLEEIAAEQDLLDSGLGDRARLDHLQSQYDGVRSMARSLSQRYEGYLTKHSALLRELKGTRDQRIKNIEDRKTSFLGLLKALTQEEFRDKEGREAELMRRATEKERERLARPITYGDGVVDQPLLTPETILDET